MKQYLLFVVFFTLGVTVVCRAQQVHPDTVYVLFDITSTETCTVDVEGKGYQEVNKFFKIDEGRTLTFFHICGELFVFNKKHRTPDTASIDAIPSQRVVDIEEMIEIYDSLEPREFKHHVFDTVFLIEETDGDTVLKYKVRWNDEALGIIE